MRDVFMWIIVLLLITAVAGIWRGSENGRFSMVAESEGEKLWILDTRTGEAQLFNTWFHEPRTIRRFQESQKKEKK